MAGKLTLPSRRNIQNRRSWHGMAFIMESLVLVVFLVVSMAILMQVFSAARMHGNQAYSLSYAVILASNEAERFAVDPSADTVGYYAVEDGALVGSDEMDEDAYKVSRSIQPQQEPNGVLYRATIVVEQYGERVYELASAHYVENSGVTT